MKIKAAKKLAPKPLLSEKKPKKTATREESGAASG